jgi:hypothetical protein
MHCISLIHCNKLYFSQKGGETELVSGVYTFSLNKLEKQTRKEKKSASSCCCQQHWRLVEPYEVFEEEFLCQKSQNVLFKKRSSSK